MDLSEARENVMTLLEEFLDLMGSPRKPNELSQSPKPILEAMPKIQHADSVPGLGAIPGIVDKALSGARIHALASDVDDAGDQAHNGNLITNDPGHDGNAASSPERHVKGLEKLLDAIAASPPPTGPKLDCSRYLFNIRRVYMKERYENLLVRVLARQMGTEVAPKHRIEGPIVLGSNEHLDGPPRVNIFARLSWQLDRLGVQLSNRSHDYFRRHNSWHALPMFDDNNRSFYKILESLVMTYGYLDVPELFAFASLLFPPGLLNIAMGHMVCHYLKIAEADYGWPDGLESKMMSTWILNRRQNFWRYREAGTQH